MNGAESRTYRQGATTKVPSAQPAGRLLIVEPEALVRWSLVTYLSKWFDVCSADSRDAADHILDDQRIDAVVVSDDLSDRAAEAIEAHARLRNPTARIVRTVTDPPHEPVTERATPRIEKPFELSRLAALLGISLTPPDEEAKGSRHPGSK